MYFSCIILFKSYKIGSIIIVFSHIGNGRYKRLVTLVQCHRVSLMQINLYPTNATLSFSLHIRLFIIIIIIIIDVSTNTHSS